MDDMKDNINRVDDEEAFAEETVEEAVDLEPDGEPDESESAETPDEEKQPEESPEEKSEEEKPEEPQEEPEASGEGESGKGSPFRRKEKKDKKDEQIEELNDRVRRQMAEFDNYRKRTEKEKSQMFEMGAKSVLEKMLPVIDNFERGLATVPEEEREAAFADGMNKIYKQMITVMDDLGVTPIEAVGEEFDPNLHNAVMHAEDEEVGENIVVEELQKGYMYRDSVLRHSMVKVAN
ncbi:MAG: nucleotide exchange factor GrpE [Lachnospiraceae bacterium]|nr:nucleotide exchange factor GrpE [Lachnospiraceae bacterium]